MSTLGTGTFGGGRFGDPAYEFVAGHYKRLAWKVRWDEGYQGKVGFKVPELVNMRYAAPQMEQGELPTAFALNPDDLLPGRVEGGGGLGHIAARTINAEDIQANTITGNEIKAQTITATELDVGHLSAITGDLGSITAGLITLDGGETGLGGLVQSSVDDPKVTFDERGLVKTSADGTEALRIGPNESLMFGPTASEAQTEIIDTFNQHPVGSFAGGASEYGPAWSSLPGIGLTNATIWGEPSAGLPREKSYLGFNGSTGLTHQAMYDINLGSLIYEQRNIEIKGAGEIKFTNVASTGNTLRQASIALGSEAYELGGIGAGYYTFNYGVGLTTLISDNLIYFWLTSGGHPFIGMFGLPLTTKDRPLYELINSGTVHLGVELSRIIGLTQEHYFIKITNLAANQEYETLFATGSAVSQNSGHLSLLLRTNPDGANPLTVGISEVSVQDFTTYEDRRIEWESSTINTPTLLIAGQEYHTSGLSNAAAGIMEVRSPVPGGGPPSAIGLLSVEDDSAEVSALAGGYAAPLLRQDGTSEFKRESDARIVAEHGGGNQVIPYASWTAMRLSMGSGIDTVDTVGNGPETEMLTHITSGTEYIRIWRTGLYAISANATTVAPFSTTSRTKLMSVARLNRDGVTHQMVAQWQGSPVMNTVTQDRFSYSGVVPLYAGEVYMVMLYHADTGTSGNSITVGSGELRVSRIGDL